MADDGLEKGHGKAAEIENDSKDGLRAPDLPGQIRRARLEPPEFVKSLSAEERAVLEKRLMRKIDLRLMPAIIIMYILNYIDR